MKCSPETWHVSTRLARVWVSPRRKEPYRPYHMLVTSDQEQVVKAQLVEHPPSADQVWEYMLNTMLRPMLGGGHARRPQAITFEDEDILKTINPSLAELGIHSSFQLAKPPLKDMLEDLERMMSRKSGEIHSLLSIPRVTIPLLVKIFASASDLYQLQPWNKLSPQIPIAIWTPLQNEPRYVVFTGGAGTPYGFSIHEALEDLEKIFSSMKPHRLSAGMNWLALTYDHPSSLPFDDLDTIEAYALEVAGAHAYPLIYRIVTPAEVHSPSIHDLFWLEIALPAMVRWFQRHHIDGIGIDTPPAEFIYDIKTLDGSARVRVSIPIKSGKRS